MGQSPSPGAAPSAAVARKRHEDTRTGTRRLASGLRLRIPQLAGRRRVIRRRWCWQVPVGLACAGVGVACAQFFAYVPNEGSGTVSVIDTRGDRVVAQVAAGAKP